MGAFLLSFLLCRKKVTHVQPPPPPLVHPPQGGGGGSHWLISGKNVSVSYWIELCNRETSLSELMWTSFVVTHCTPLTFENVP